MTYEVHSLVRVLVDAPGHRVAAEKAQAMLRLALGDQVGVKAIHVREATEKLVVPEEE